MANKKQINTIIKKDQQKPAPVSLGDVQNKIIVLRGEPVILDRDVAKLYGVETKDINRALKNNPNKFPIGYTYTLNNQEVAEMRLKILTTSSETAENEQVSPAPICPLSPLEPHWNFIGTSLELHRNLIN